MDAVLFEITLPFVLAQAEEGGVFSSLPSLFKGAGIFVWPLALCSLLAVFIIVERFIALRDSKIIPEELEDAFISGHLPKQVAGNSVAGRLINFFNSRHPDSEQIKSYARLQIVRMERGLFILDTVISAAPLLGLLGTVTGLVQVFGGVSPQSGLPNPDSFVKGVALALTTTIIGLAIAIPALVFANYLNRRIDTLAAKIDVGVQRLLSLREQELKQQGSQQEK